MEPLNCTVRITADKCEIWTGTQFQTVDQATAAADHRPQARAGARSTPSSWAAASAAGPRRPSDFVREAVEVAKAAKLPVKTVWTREDDIHGGYYRPAVLPQGEGRPRRQGRARGLAAHARRPVVPDRHAVRGRWSRTASTRPPSKACSTPPYLTDVPDHLVEHARAEVARDHAVVALRRPLPQRLRHGDADRRAGQGGGPGSARLSPRPPGQASRAISACSTSPPSKAGWGKPLPAGRFRGLAVHESFGSFVAQVAEVSVDGGRDPRPPRRLRDRLRHRR